MNKIALFILYNHHYTKNIDRTEELYKDKFSYIFHLIPFYNGDRENVITVYESSFQFQSYIAQAYQVVKNNDFTHYFVVADDMIINPQINELNLFEYTGIQEDSSFITDFICHPNYPEVIPLCVNLKQRGVEVFDILPQKEDAVGNLKQRGLNVMPPKKYAFKLLLRAIAKLQYGAFRNNLFYIKKRNLSSVYPVVWGYSDILLIPVQYMESFCRYCGAFAALNVFVEFAIPTALCLSSDRIMNGKDIKLKYITQLYTLGEKGMKEFEQRYLFSLQKLLDNYPNDMFFVHPIKLSKWK